jgi:hypothetical protein
MNSDRLVHEIIDKLDSLDQYRAELTARPTQASTATAQ